MNDMVPSGGSDSALVVTVDNRQALAGINNIIYGFTRMNQAAVRSSTAITTSFQKMTQWITRAGVALATYFAGRAVFNGITSLLNRMIEVNRVFTGFMATMNVVKGSTAAARKEYEFLFGVAQRLGVSIETTTSNYARLAAALKNVDKEGELTRHLFTAISQAAVVLHARGRDVHLIFEAFQQMASKGKLSLEELQRQLGNTLPGAVGLAARAMEMSEAQLRKGIEKGTINVYEFLAKVANQIRKEYGGSVDYAASQFTARMNAMKNSVFELFRVAGDSGAMEGLIKLVNRVTELLSDPTLGKSLGESIGFIAEQIEGMLDSFDAEDMNTGFLAIAGGVHAFGLVVSETDELVKDFVGSVTDIGSPGTLDSIEFITNAFLGLIDVLKALLSFLKGVMNAIGATGAFVGNMVFTALDTAVNAQERLASMLPERLDFGRGARESYRNFRQPIIDAQERWTAGANAGFDGVGTALSEGGVLRNRMYFDELRNRSEQGRQNAAAAERAKLPPLFRIPNYANPSADLTPLLANRPTDYMRPQTTSEVEAMIAGFPNPTGGTDPKGSKGKTDAQRLAENFARESIKLIKARSQAENELMNVQANRFEQEGQFEQQTRLLLETDADFVKLSAEKQAELIGLAKAADEAALALERMRTVQAYSNDTLREGYAIQTQIDQLNAGNYSSRYNETTTMQQSFMRGGENEFLDETSRNQMLASATARDDQNRALAMAEYAASIRLANEEMLFQNELLGKSEQEIEKLNEFRKIDLWVQQQSVGASEEQIEKLREMADVLKNEVGAALDEVNHRQSSMFAGITDGIQQWLDQTEDVAGKFQTVTVSAIDGLSDAFVDFLETGKLSFDDLANQIWKQITKIVFELLVVKPLMQSIQGMISVPENGTATAGNSGGGGWMQAIGSFFGGMFGGGSFNGNVFSSGRMQAFANGGIVSSTTAFPMTGGKFGLMGERGPEAIMPLTRDSSGRLGVRTSGGGNTYNNTTIVKVAASESRRTVDQVANRTADVTRTAQRRNK